MMNSSMPTLAKTLLIILAYISQLVQAASHLLITSKICGYLNYRALNILHLNCQRGIQKTANSKDLY